MINGEIKYMQCLLEQKALLQEKLVKIEESHFVFHIIKLRRSSKIRYIKQHLLLNTDNFILLKHHLLQESNANLQPPLTIT